MITSANAVSLESRIAAPLRDSGQPCAHDCAFAQTIRSDPFGESWLWCMHPANTTRVVHPGRLCPRYAPTTRLTGSRLDDLTDRSW